MEVLTQDSGISGDATKVARWVLADVRCQSAQGGSAMPLIPQAVRQWLSRIDCSTAATALVTALRAQGLAVLGRSGPVISCQTA